jgi:hypothetical protein
MSEGAEGFYIAKNRYRKSILHALQDNDRNDDRISYIAL